MKSKKAAQLVIEDFSSTDFLTCYDWSFVLINVKDCNKKIDSSWFHVEAHDEGLLNWKVST